MAKRVRTVLTREWTDGRSKTRWQVEMTFEPVAPRGLFECVKVTVQSAESPPLPVTATVVRRIPIAGLIDAEKRQMAQSMVQVAEAYRTADLPEWAAEEREGIVKDFEEVADQYAPRTGPGRRRRPVDYARVAAVYKANDHGQRSTPTKAVAEAFKVPGSTANKWVARAREMGLLPEPDRGRPRRRDGQKS